MNLTNEFQPIRDWAKEKGIYEKGDIKTQTMKLQEEIGELANAVLKKEFLLTSDAIGDCVVVLTSIAEFNGMKIEDCINAAFQVIKNRKGKMKDGNFVKDSELPKKLHY
jgi:NTP pyrophosphatase (non-canonical NTP hydrolase)